MGLRTWIGLKKANSVAAKSAALAREVVSSGRPYQPLGTHRGASQLRSNEAFEARWLMISMVLRECEARNLCDIGCAEGMYVRRAAALGIFSIGIDYEPQRIRYANAVSELDQDWSSGFVRMSVDKNTIGILPCFDVVLFMSVFHHMVLHQGYDAAREILRAVARIVKKRMIFDTGGPDEPMTGKSEAMSFLSHDSDRDIIALLIECGFKDVRTIGSAQGFGEGTKRTMFVATPTP